MNPSIVLCEEGTGVQNALSGIKFCTSLICSGVSTFMQRYSCCPIVYTSVWKYCFLTYLNCYCCLVVSTCIS